MHLVIRGTIENISSSVEGGPIAEYSYVVNGKRYKGLFSMPATDEANPPREPKLKDRFLIKYYSKNPAFSYAYYEKLIDSNIVAPSNGWLTVPDNINAEYKVQD